MRETLIKFISLLTHLFRILDYKSGLVILYFESEAVVIMKTPVE